MSRSGGETSASAHSRISRTPAAVARIEAHASGVGPAHLHGKPDDLRHQEGQQHQEIPIADEERFHMPKLRDQGQAVRDSAKPDETAVSRSDF